MESGSTPWSGNSSGNFSAAATPSCRPSSSPKATATSARKPRRPRATTRRLPEHHGCRSVSIFGELTIDRVVYGTREAQSIERVPLNERLGLPEDDFSYVLEDWGQRLSLKGSFAEVGPSLGMLLGQRVVGPVMPRPSRTPWRCPRPRRKVR